MTDPIFKMSNLHISNLCSDSINFKKFLNIVSKFKNIKGLDIAPLNISKDWESSEKECKKFYNFIKKKNLRVNAVQGIFYKKNFSLLKDFVKNDNKIISHFKKIISLCKILRCNKIIFGSSEFRNRNGHTIKYTNIIFIRFIKKIIPLLKKNNIVFCIETIPRIYNSNYLYKFTQTCKIIKFFKNKFIKINFDSGIFFNSKLSKSYFINNLDLIDNIQISEPYFNFFLNPNKYNLNFIKLLKNQHYQGTVSLEIISEKFENKKINKSINNFTKLFS